MALIRMLVLLVIFGGIAVFVLQNLSPVLPLVFFGSQTLFLPVGLWLLFFLLAGGITGFILQFITYSPRQSPKDYRKNDVFSSPNPSLREKSYDKKTTASNERSHSFTEPEQAPISPPTKKQTKPQKEKVKLKDSQENPFSSVSVPSSDKVDSLKADKIHDANYRVIKPPNNQQYQVEEDEDEEWI